MKKTSKRGEAYDVARVKVSSKNQIAIPAEIRRELGIRAGDNLVLMVRAEHAVLMRDPMEHPEELTGKHPEIWAGVDVAEYIRHEREAWTNS